MKSLAIAILLSLIGFASTAQAATFTEDIPQSAWTPALGAVGHPAPSLVAYGDEMVWTGGSDGTLVSTPLPIPVGCTLLDFTVRLNVLFSLTSMSFFVQPVGSYSAIASWTSSSGGPALQIATIPASFTKTSSSQTVPLYAVFHSQEQIFHGASLRYSCP